VEPPKSEAELVRLGASALAQRLPSGWSVEAGRADRVDAILVVRDGGGSTVRLVAEVKRSVEGRDVAGLKAQLGAAIEAVGGGQGLVIARYLSPPVRAKLVEAGLSYLDATGNVRVEANEPGLFVSDRGADRDPWRGPGRPRGTLKGEPAAKVVRAIADFGDPWTMRELAELSKASTGATYRVVDFLEREGLAERDDGGRLTVSDWAAVLRRWSNDYSFLDTNPTTLWIAPRGLPNFLERVAEQESDTHYAVTGTVAAAEWEAYAPARLAMVYVNDAPAAAERWDLRPTESGANVILAEPTFDVVFARTVTNSTGLTLAAPTQVAVDLMTGPGRNPVEAEELLGWMKRNEQSWRT